MLSKDELCEVLSGNSLEGLKEYKISFLPSYKFIQFTSEYDYKEGKRIPSYTDRIVYINNDFKIDV